MIVGFCSSNSDFVLQHSDFPRLSEFAGATEADLATE